MTREIPDISDMTAYDWGMIAIWLMLLVAMSSYLYCAFRLMGYLKVSHRRFWEELGSPQPGKIQWPVTLRLIWWLISGHYVQSGDPYLIGLARMTRYSLLAVPTLGVLGSVGLQLLMPGK